MIKRAIPVLLAVLAVAACAKRGPQGVLTASGTIEAIEVEVSSKVGGQLLERPVDEGDRVAPGDKVGLVDHANLDIQLRQAEAVTAQAEAQLELLRKGARREDIQQAEEALRQAEASYRVADQDARRMRDLEKTASATPKQREDADARLTVTQAQLNAAREALNKVRRLSRPEEIQAAEARLDQARAAADLLRKTISDCLITAPVGGYVTHKAAEAGEMVAPGAPIVTISTLDSVYVMIYVTEKEMGLVKLGQPADVAIDAFPGRLFPGKVSYISPEAEFTPKNIQTKDDRVKLVFGVKIDIENKDGLLKPGLPADATIHVGPPPAAR